MGWGRKVLIPVLAGLLMSCGCVDEQKTDYEIPDERQEEARTFFLEVLDRAVRHDRTNYPEDRAWAATKAMYGRSRSIE